MGATRHSRFVDREPYQAELVEDFHPWCRRVEFAECEEAPIRPLIADLVFIEDEENWGYPFRRGLFEIGRDDFERIAGAMDVAIARVENDKV